MNIVNFVKKNIVLIGMSLAILLLVYSRLVNLSWGLPYPFHPDERNMADAIMRLSCSGFNTDCFNPHFFAYGQLPLYLGYLLTQFYHFISGNITISMTFNEAVMALRSISALTSIILFFVLQGVFQSIIQIYKKNSKLHLLEEISTVIFSFIVVFTPGLIQFAHFGTTESLLMLFYTALLYVSLLWIQQKISSIKFGLLSGIIVGLSVATKVSALNFLILPIVVQLYRVILEYRKEHGFSVKAFLFVSSFLIWISFLIAMLFSPYNFIAFEEFMNSIQYESAVGFGSILVFYTRQFFSTTPIIFQFLHIFPYSLGIPITVLFILGFLSLPNKKEFNVLRLAFLIYFIPSAFLYTKWSRFMAPIFPVMIIIASAFLLNIFEIIHKKALLSERKYIVLGIFVFISIICSVPGIAYLSIYRTEDVRFTASKWIYTNISANSLILTETANVIDLPILPPDILTFSRIKGYNTLSFNFYELDNDPLLPLNLQTAWDSAEYIIVPSRRLFANHTCLNVDNTTSSKDENKCSLLREKYPLLNQYYQDLFSEKNFVLIKEFKSFPQIKIGSFRWELPDEKAEETWTVFDHPVIRIYKRK